MQARPVPAPSGRRSSQIIARNRTFRLAWRLEDIVLRLEVIIVSKPRIVAGNAWLWLVMSILTSCSLEHRELARIASPDHTTSAILVWAYGGGAAGSSEHDVYIVDASATKLLDKPVLTVS